jgi:hypothetical protein
MVSRKPLPKVVFLFGMVASLVFLWTCTPKAPPYYWVPSQPAAPSHLLIALAGMLLALLLAGLVRLAGGLICRRRGL